MAGNYRRSGKFLEKEDEAGVREKAFLLARNFLNRNNFALGFYMSVVDFSEL